jgi:hypothetical protein
MDAQTASDTALTGQASSARLRVGIHPSSARSPEKSPDRLTRGFRSPARIRRNGPHYSNTPVIPPGTTGALKKELGLRVRQGPGGGDLGCGVAGLPLPTAKAIEIQAFVPLESIDPIRIAEGYYVVGLGQVGIGVGMLRRQVEQAPVQVARMVCSSRTNGLNPAAVASSWPAAPAAVPRPGPESLSGEDLGQGWTERMIFDTVAAVVPGARTVLRRLVEVGGTASYEEVQDHFAVHPRHRSTRSGSAAHPPASAPYGAGSAPTTGPTSWSGTTAGASSVRPSPPNAEGLLCHLMTLVPRGQAWRA